MNLARIELSTIPIQLTTVVADLVRGQPAFREIVIPQRASKNDRTEGSLPHPLHVFFARQSIVEILL